MKRVLFWVLSVGAWIIAAGAAYIGLVFLILGPMITEQGDIDFTAYPEERQRAAYFKGFWISAFGLVPLTLAVLILWFHRQVIRWLLAPFGNQRPI